MAGWSGGLEWPVGCIVDVGYGRLWLGGVLWPAGVMERWEIAFGGSPSGRPCGLFGVSFNFVSS